MSRPLPALLLTLCVAASVPARAAKAPAAELPAAQLRSMTTGQVDAFIREVHAEVPDLAARVEVFSRAQLGIPYRLGPLGEGPDGAFDTDPLLSFQEADCVTFVEQTLALAFGRDLASAEDVLRRIRYDGGMIRYACRNHFTEADWLPNNIKAGFLEDITGAVAGADLKVATKTVDKAAWYGQKTAEALEGEALRALPAADKERLALAWRESGKDLPPQAVSLPYLPMAVLPKHLDAVPSGTVVSIVREDKAGVPTIVSHQGLLIKRGGAVWLRHAAAGERVQDVPFLEYFYKFFNASWRVLGLNLARPVQK
jgi:hypothetical protein